MKELIPYLGVITGLASFVATFAVVKTKVKSLEDRRIEDREYHKEEILKVSVSKNARIKELKSDTLRMIEEQKKDSQEKYNKLESKIDELGKEVRDGNRMIIETLNAGK